MEHPTYSTYLTKPNQVFIFGFCAKIQFLFITEKGKKWIAVPVNTGWVGAVGAKTTEFSHHLGCGSQQSIFIPRMRFLRFWDI